jgi:DNA-binding transcriptional regulator YiaG
VGARLDERPELLFLLRGVNQEELISIEAGAVAASGKSGGRKRIADGDLTDVFGIDIAEQAAAVSEPSPKTRAAPVSGPKRGRKKTAAAELKSSRSGKARKSAAGNNTDHRLRTQAKTAGKEAVVKRAPTSRGASASAVVTGKAVAKLRASFQMSQSQFARILGVSGPTVNNWEKRKGRLHLQTRTLEAWNAVTRLGKKEAWERLEAV